METKVITKKIKIPSSLKDIRLNDYITFIKAIDGIEDKEIINKLALRVFLGLDDDSVKAIPLLDMVDINKTLVKILNEEPKLVYRFTVGDIEYGLIPDWNRITFGEYLDLVKLDKGIEDIATIMAIMYRPIIKRKKDKYSILRYDIETMPDRVIIMQGLRADIGISLLFFCKTNYEKLLSNTTGYTPQVLGKA